MKKTFAIKRLGGVRKIAAALNLSVQAVYKWPEDIPSQRLEAVRALIAATHKIASRDAGKTAVTRKETIV